MGIQTTNISSEQTHFLFEQVPTLDKYNNDSCCLFFSQNEQKYRALTTLSKKWHIHVKQNKK